ncbi:PREDICTED: probable LRR receptor-like serine/threonine-protein kinase At1g06840 [Branchiostoma belcheri]|uniref:Probable LRR receptor-like serine/threonine-protein kinase At1g06840 n=1 Tax=Branchiostoma belcheri TaxID=7741 RepID=A0A6P4YQ85_BRABE|nr:PREDICTED: probable LRR receptor-like serine/threonine-protein kinase At1g06840 [Branchiostoma belcheri]
MRLDGIIRDKYSEKLREASEAYRQTRVRLTELCNSIADYLPSLDKSIKARLKQWLGCEAEEIIQDVKDQLQKKECPIFVAGETSSGKSTFLNLLLGSEFLPVALLSSTSTICEVKYGKTKRAVVHLRQPTDQEQRQITIPLDGTKRRQKELESYIHLEGASRDDLPPAERVEIFLPIDLLKGGSVLVDSPGVGENEVMDKMVADYLPKCLAFIYILDSSRAGGVQNDKLVQILKLCADNNTEKENFDPKSAIFICNKWDLVSTREQEEVKRDTFRKLSQKWPGLKESQMFFAGQLAGILSGEFTKALDGIDTLLAQILNMKLDTLCQQTSDFRDQLALFYLTHLRKYEYELDNIQGWTNTRNRLGGGAFGEVFKVQVLYKGTMTQAALKIGVYPYDVIPLPLTKENAILRNFLTEEDNLRKLKEPMDTSSDQRIHNQHIVEYYGTACKRVPRGLKLGLVTELCEGTLADRIIGQRDHNPAWWGSDPEKQAAAFSYTQNLAVQLCEGLKIIHDAGYMHRDLKLINILVTHDDVVKLADVGQSKAEVKVTGTITGTPLYVAPEVLAEQMYNKSADIYSLGILLWEMWYGKTRYQLDTEDVAYDKQMKTDLKEGKDIRMPQWRGTVPPIPEWTRLIHDCLKKDPKERPNIQECLRRISAMKV